jgi:hypothetical protein
MNNDVSHHVYILTHTISFLSIPIMNGNIHNQCSDFKLIRRRYSSNSAYLIMDPDKQVHADSIKRINLAPSPSTFKGVSMYSLKRKGVESTYIRLFVIWKYENYRKFQVFLRLTVNNKCYNWYKIHLKDDYYSHASQLYKYTGLIKYTWLL